MNRNTVRDTITAFLLDITVKNNENEPNACDLTVSNGVNNINLQNIHNIYSTKIYKYGGNNSIAFDLYRVKPLTCNKKKYYILSKLFFLGTF